MMMYSHFRCTILLLEILLFEILCILPFVCSIASFEVSAPSSLDVPCYDHQNPQFVTCGSGILTQSSFADSASVIIAPSHASQVTLTFTQFETNSTIQVFGCEDQTCVRLSRIGFFTLSAKTLPVLRNVSSMTGVIKIVKHDQNDQSSGSFRAYWSSTGIRLFSFKISDERRASLFAPFDREYHCILFDDDEPIYSIGTYGMSAYFEGRVRRGLGDLESSRSNIAWFETSLAQGAVSGGAVLRYAPNYTSVDGNIGRTGRSDLQGSFGTWTAVDGYEVAATADDIQRRCLLVKASGGTYEQALGIIGRSSPSTPVLRDNLPPLTSSLFRTPGGAFGASIRFCPAGDAALAGTYSYSYASPDGPSNIAAGDTEYGTLGQDALPFAGAAGRGVIGTWASSSGPGAGTFLYILHQPDARSPARLTGLYCRTDASGGSPRCLEDRLAYVEAAGCCPAWRSKDLSAAPARGGDLISVSGAGLTRLSQDAQYLCQFGSGAGAVLSDPADTDVASDGLLVCRTPAWPFAAGRVDFRVVARGGAAAVPYAGNDTDGLAFLFTECMLSAADTGSVQFGAYGGVVVVSEGPASGGTDLLLVGYGFDPASLAPYRCAVVGAGAACDSTAATNASARCSLDGEVSLLTHTTVFCRTPAWGARYADAWAPAARAAGTAPTRPAAAVVLHGDDEVPICPSPRVTATVPAPPCAGGRCGEVGGYPFAFFAVWSILGGAAYSGATVLGGGAVTIAGAGFDARALYLCRFWNPAWARPLFSPPAPADGPASLRCAVPASPFPASLSELSVHVLPPNASSPVQVDESNGIALVQGGSSRFAFNPALLTANPSSGPALGGTPVWLAGSGFADGGAYECVLSWESFRASVPAVALDAGTVTCTTPPWQGPAVEATLTVQIDGLAASIPFSLVATWDNTPELSGLLGGPSGGGDVLHMFGAGFDSGIRFRCEFVGQSGEMVTNATVLSFQHISCVTPAWGAIYRGQQVVVILTQDVGDTFVPIQVTDTAQGAFGISGMKYIFAPTASCGERHCGSGFAIGGSEIEISGMGLDSAAFYSCRFDGAPDLPLLLGVSITTAATVLNTTAISCIVPPWPRQAGNAMVSVMHSDISPFLSLEVTAGSYSYLSCWTGKSVSHGPSRGGGIITITGAGFFSADAVYTCEFFNNVSRSSSDAVVISSTSLVCPVPFWPYPSGTVMFGLAIYRFPVPYQGVGQSDQKFAFSEGWIQLLAPTQGSASGGVTIRVSAYGLIPYPAYDAAYQCVVTDPRNVSRTKSTNATVLSPSLLSCVLPDWGTFYPAGVVSLGIKSAQDGGYFLLRDGSNSSDGELGQQRYLFYPIWNSSKTAPRFIVAGGSSVSIQGSGFDGTVNYCCILKIFAIAFGEAETFDITAAAVSDTTSALQFTFTSFSLGKYSSMNASLQITIDDCSPQNEVIDSSVLAGSIFIVDRGVTAIHPSKGFGDGQTIVTIYGFGFNASVKYQCSFKGKLWPPNSELIYSGIVMSHETIQCSVPVLHSAASLVDFSLQAFASKGGRFPSIDIVPSYNSSCIYATGQISNPTQCHSDIAFEFLPMISDVAPKYLDRLGTTFAGYPQQVTVFGRGFDVSAAYKCQYSTDLAYATRLAQVSRSSAKDFSSTSKCTCPGGCGRMTWGVLSTGYPEGQNYDNNAYCSWILAPVGASAVSMIFLSFDTEENYDFVTLFACSDISCNTRSLLSAWSGEGPPDGSVFTSSTGIMLVLFESDALTGGLGFVSAFWGLNSIPLSADSAARLLTTSQWAIVMDSQTLVCNFPVWDGSTPWGLPFLHSANVTLHQYRSPGESFVIQIEDDNPRPVTIVEVNRPPQFQGSSISLPVCSSACSYFQQNWAGDIFPGVDSLGMYVNTEKEQSLTFSVSLSSAFDNNIFLERPSLQIFYSSSSTNYSTALEFEIRPNVVGFATFTVELRDGGSQFFGGNNVALRTFSLTILPPFKNISGPGKISIMQLQMLENSGRHVISGIVQEIVGINRVDEVFVSNPELISASVGQVQLSILLELVPGDAKYFENAPSFVLPRGNISSLLSDCLLEFRTADFAFGKINMSLKLSVTHNAAVQFVNSENFLNTVPGIDIESRIILIELEILPVNQPPTFTMLSYAFVANAEFSPTFEQRIAVNILPGPNISASRGPNGEDWAETGQRWTFYIQGASPIFAQQPSVNQSGFLSFTIKKFRSGVSAFQIWLVDDGVGLDHQDQIADGEMSAISEFQIEVEGINDPPYFQTACNSDVSLSGEDAQWYGNCSQCATDKGNCTIVITILENCLNCERPNQAECPGFFTQPSFASSIRPSVHQSPDEQMQNLSFQFTFMGGNQFLFDRSAGPAIDVKSGSLTFCVGNSESGSALYNFSLLDSGGTLRGGSDTFGNIQLSISVLPVNEKPQFQICLRQYFGICEDGSCSDDKCEGEIFVWSNSSKQELQNYLHDTSNGPANSHSLDSESTQQNTITIHFNDSYFFVESPSLSANGTLTFELNSSLSTGSQSVQIVMVDDGLPLDYLAGTQAYCAENGIPYQGANQTLKSTNFHSIDSYLRIVLNFTGAMAQNDSDTVKSDTRDILSAILNIERARIFVDDLSRDTSTLTIKVLGYSIQENILLHDVVLASMELTLHDVKSPPPALVSAQPCVKNLGWIANFTVTQNLLKHYGLSFHDNQTIAFPGLVSRISSGQDWPLSDRGDELMAFDVRPIQYRITADPFEFMSRQTLAWTEDGSDGGQLSQAPSVVARCELKCAGDAKGNLTASLTTTEHFELYTEILFEIQMRYTSIVRNFSVLIFEIPSNRPPLFQINASADTSHVTVTNNTGKDGIEYVVSVVVNENCIGLSALKTPPIQYCESNAAHPFSLSDFIVPNSTFSMDPALYALDPYLDGFMDERGQNLTFIIRNLSSEDLFSGKLPDINVSTGSLTFCLRHDMYGEANFSVHLQDDGEASHGGINKSPAFLLRILVLPVNQPPSFRLAAVTNVSDVCFDLGIESPRYCTGSPYLMWAKSGMQSVLPFVLETSRTDLVELDWTEAWQSLSFHILQNSEVSRHRMHPQGATKYYEMFHRFRVRRFA